ncbi:amidase domain-containing protein [Dactylosporangium sp. CA-139066]|uniref:amidase domain-containing protein n=1 Tax=Dactylosporangium sp. CA-139066 TaxID=3239930 RepID=UPI003D8DA4FA
MLSAAALGGATAALPAAAFAAPPKPENGDVATVAALAKAHLADRAGRITAAGALGGIPSTTGADSARMAAADRLEGVRKQLNALHGGYSRATTTVSVAALTPAPSRIIARVVEETSLYYAQYATADADHTTYWAEHEVELQRSGSRWVLAGVRFLPVNAFSIPANQFLDELPDELRAVEGARAAKAGKAVQPAGKPSSPNTAKPSGPVTAKGAATSLALASYDYTAMVNYARAWATGRNPAYPSYSDDCTNFASQVMRAGGWATVGSWPLSSRSSNSNWWYGSYASTSSYTWGGAENWYWFATGSGRTYIIDMWNMGNGDVLQYDYDFDGNISHTQVCTGRDSTGPLMTQHGSDYRDKRLTEIMASSSNYNAWKYAHRT